MKGSVMIAPEIAMYGPAMTTRKAGQQDIRRIEENYILVIVVKTQCANFVSVPFQMSTGLSKHVELA